jgi:hypothetical protein
MEDKHVVVNENEKVGEVVDSVKDPSLKSATKPSPITIEMMS